jgi:hypothetical protein
MTTLAQSPFTITQETILKTKGQIEGQKEGILMQVCSLTGIETGV